VRLRSSSMSTSSQNRRSILPPAGASTLAHLFAIAVIVALTYQHPLRIISSSGMGSGKHIDLVYMPAGGPNPAPLKKVHKSIQSGTKGVAKIKTPAAAPPSLPSLTLPKVTMEPASSPTQAASAAGAPDPTYGSGISTSGDAEQIALTSYSPSPSPDLSVLPKGLQGDVVVDVTIGSDGKVSDLTLLKTLGYGIENSVMSTVRTWVFHPATKNGVPVASVQELLFHYGSPA
jgi:periplasmic protein TonB